MLRLYIGNFMAAVINIERLKWFSAGRHERDMELSDYRRQVNDLKQPLTEEFKHLPVSPSLKQQVTRLVNAAERSATTDQDADLMQVMTLAEEVIRNLQAEIIVHLFVCVDGSRRQLYEQPSEWFGIAATSKFSDIEADVRDACRCFALEQWTASVFHSMRILEIGLRALAAHVGVSLKFSLDFADWQVLIDGIDAKLRTTQQQAKSQERSDEMEFLSRSAAEFRYFKEAWRNHVSHARRSYNPEEAESVLSHTRDFMRTLAAVLP